MKILIAPDSFKESLSALEVAQHIAAGVRRVFPEAVIQQVPLSDGGEGFTESLTAARGGDLERHQVTGPRGEKSLPVWISWSHRNNRDGASFSV